MDFREELCNDHNPCFLILISVQTGGVRRRSELGLFLKLKGELSWDCF